MENTWRPTDAPCGRAWTTALASPRSTQPGASLMAVWLATTAASVLARFVAASLSATYVLIVNVTRVDAEVWT